MIVGRERKYDPKPGEFFCGQLVLGPSDRPNKPGARWYSVACPGCGEPRDVCIYDLTAGGCRRCMRCHERGTTWTRALGGFGPSSVDRSVYALGTHLDSYLDDVLPVTAKPKGLA